MREGSDSWKARAPEDEGPNVVDMQAFVEKRAAQAREHLPLNRLSTMEERQILHDLGFTEESIKGEDGFHFSSLPDAAPLDV